MRIALTAVALALVATGCPNGCSSPTGGEGEGDPQGEGEGEGEVAIVPSLTGPRDNLRWRTGWAFQQHLMAALQLQEDEVCNELGSFPCVVRPAAERPFRPDGAPDAVPVPHLVALGGNEPFDVAQYVAPSTPSSTSAVATDRVVLAACDKRVETERVSPVLLVGVDLTSATTLEAAATAITNVWFSRFHLRDPSTAERTTVLELAVDDQGASVPVADFALASCLAIGAMSESLFD